MKVLGSAAAVAVMLAACETAQAAQITVEKLGGSNAVAFRETPGGPFIVSDFQGKGVATGFSGASSYDSQVVLGNDGVLFRSGSSVVGEYVVTNSSSGILVRVTNTTSETLRDLKLKSTIIPAGMGFYIADRSGGCSGDELLGCPQASNHTFSDFDVSPLAQGGALLGTVGYSFSVSTDLGQAHYQEGRFSLFKDSVFGVRPRTDRNDLNSLDGFRTRSSNPEFGNDLNNQSAFGYVWDATDVLIPLGDLEAGQTRIIRYFTQVSTGIQTGCIEEVYCLATYGGFGDPIGRGGAIDQFRTSAFDALDAPTGGITGITFRDERFGPLTLNGSTLEFNRVPPAAVPEPSTWAMMILGFGAAGAVIRRRRVPARA